MRTSIAAIILNYKNSQDTTECYRRLKSSDLGSLVKYYIVDNSIDSTEAKKLEKSISEPIIINKGNLGFAGGNNVGIKSAILGGATHILIINPDVRVKHSFFKPLMSHFQDPKVGIVAPAIRHKQKNRTIFGLDGKVDWQFAKPTHDNTTRINSTDPIDSEFVTFACVLISVNTFRKAGLIDDGYFMYFEDVDYCLLARSKGVKIILDPSVIVDHNTSNSFSKPTGKLPISFKSHLRFISKWLPLAKRLVPTVYALCLYPYLYLLWTYHSYKYAKRK